jgi:hypothetical protein
VVDWKEWPTATAPGRGRPTFFTQNLLDQFTFQSIDSLHEAQIDHGLYGTTTMAIADFGAVAFREATIALATAGLGNLATGARAATWVGRAAYVGHTAGLGYEVVSGLNQVKIGAEKLADGNLWGLADIALGAVPLAGLKNALRLPGARVTRPGPVAAGLDDAANTLSRNSRLIRGTNPSRLVFEGLEVRAVRNLSHIADDTLRVMAKKGFAAKDINGEQLVLHHLGQNPAGPLAEMPALRHSIGNRVQHPFGNAPGVGLTADQRAGFDLWRESYWKARALEELARRGLTP